MLNFSKSVQMKENKYILEDQSTISVFLRWLFCALINLIF